MIVVTCSEYLTSPVLQQVFERLLRSLVDPRLFHQYDLIGDALVIITSIFLERGMYGLNRWFILIFRIIKEIIKRIVQKDSIEEISSLYRLLLRIPLANQAMEVLRCTIAYFVLERIQLKSCCCLFIVHLSIALLNSLCLIIQNVVACQSNKVWNWNAAIPKPCLLLLRHMATWFETR